MLPPALGLVLVAAPASPVRSALALPLAAFLPGYAVLAVLFPGFARSAATRSLDGIERVVLSIGLSVAMVALLGLGLAVSGVGLRLEPLLLALGAVVMVLAVLGLRARAALPAEAWPVFEVDVPRTRGPHLSLRSAATAATLAVALGAFAVVLTAPGVADPFTEFYVLGLDGQLPALATIAPGSPAAVRLVVVNHEGARAAYTVSAVDERAGSPPAGALWLGEADVAAGARWQAEVPFVLDGDGVHRLAFQLWREDDAAPYRSLHVTVHVGEALIGPEPFAAGGLPPV